MKGGVYLPWSSRKKGLNLCRAIMAAILAACLVMLPGCARGQQATSSRVEQARPAVSVAVQKVSRVTIEREVVAGGQLAAIRKAVVAPKTVGRVAQVRVTVGQAVKAGDILFELDKTDVESQLRQARADLVAAQENKKLADINRENARRQWERYKELFEAGAVSRDTYEQYLLKYQQASVGTAEAQLERAQAQVAALETQLESMTVRAPFAGQVSKVAVNLGEMVSSSSQCVELVDLSRVKVTINVGEGEVNKLQVGQECRVIVSAVRQEPFTARVTAISPSAEEKSKGFSVEVTLDNSANWLKPGMYGEVHLVAERARDALAVPVDAVVNRNGKNAVFVVQGDTARVRTVVTGISDGRLVEIREGLTEGEQVVVVGQQGLTEGAKVVIAGGEAGGRSPSAGGAVQGRQGPPAAAPTNSERGEKR